MNLLSSAKVKRGIYTDPRQGSRGGRSFRTLPLSAAADQSLP
jgi:hypothetical protein